MVYKCWDINDNRNLLVLWMFHNITLKEKKKYKICFSLYVKNCSVCKLLCYKRRCIKCQDMLLWINNQLWKFGIIMGW